MLFVICIYVPTLNKIYLLTYLLNDTDTDKVFNEIDWEDRIYCHRSRLKWKSVHYLSINQSLTTLKPSKGEIN